MFDDFEIIIVNDASTDDTAAIADRLAQKYSSVRVIHNPVNLGQGGSIKKAFAATRKQLVIHNGIDCPFRLEDLKHLVPNMNRVDVMVAARKSRAGYSPYRTLISRVNRLLIRSLFQIPMRDFNFVQLYKATVVHEVEVRSSSAGFVIPELLISARDLGFVLDEMEIDYYPREQGQSHHGRLKVIMKSFSDLMNFWLYRQFKGTRRSVAAQKFNVSTVANDQECAQDATNHQAMTLEMTHK
jgi:glycosyltransferase involved in cell wall biosynthesis